MGVLTPLEALFLATSAAVGGGLNAVAGGGSFVAFPALLFVGVPPVSANATNAVALWPASVTSAYAHRSELSASREDLPVLGAVSVAGGVIGALLLLWTPNSTFTVVIPWLLLAATLVFSFGKKVSERLATSGIRVGGAAGVAVQFCVAVYGGYFGGGMGIVMLAAFAAMGMTSVVAMNALKNVLATLINFVAIVTFVAHGEVTWLHALPMLAGAALGGYGAARYMKSVPPSRVRTFVLFVAWSMTLYFFFKTYA